MEQFSLSGADGKELEYVVKNESTMYVITYASGLELRG